MLVVLLFFLFTAPLYAAEMGVAQSAAPTSDTGTQDLTVSGFGTPLCAMFFTGYGTANGTAVDHAMMSVGLTDFTRSYSISGAAEDAQADADSGASSGTTALRTLSATAQAVDGTATAATITNGVRLTWADAPPTAYLVNGVLFGGSNISNCYVGTLAGNATQDATAATTAPGFQPDLIIAIAENGTTHQRNSVGFAVNDGGIVQRAAGIQDQNGAASMQTGAVLHTSRLAVNPFGSGLSSLELTTIGATGFTVTTRDAAGSITIGYLAIKFSGGVRAKLLTCASPTATGNHTCTGAGWTPQAGLMLHTESAAVNTYYATDDGEVLGLSAFTSSASGSSAVYHEDSDGTSNTESVTDTKPVQLRKDGAAFMTATFSAWTTDGVTFNYSVAPGSAAQRALLLIEEPSSGSSLMMRRRADRGGM